ncbi:MAG: hypothetical protein IPG07_13415 [Crocinitomicaceae bacterium]|nr:hypothetical protein [Crocinitomicaceae bacterium]MBK6952971.1 hypothetical protein [Crocinitomicaceae bacterium]
MKYILPLSLIFISLQSCGTSKSIEEAETEIENEVEVVTEDENKNETFPSLTKTVQAKVIHEPFINKAGKLIEGAGDYFLVYEGQNWFIKFSAGTVLRSDVEKFEGKTATCTVMELDGLWDTNDPNVQSRVGKYVALYSITAL